MPLPFSVTRSLTISGVSDPTSATDRLERGLEKLKARRITRRGPIVDFRGGMFRPVSNHNLLVAINTGRLQVEPYHSGVRVSFRLEFLQIFWMVSAMVLGFLGPFVLSSSNLSWGEAALVLLGFWLWLFGGNVLITLFRFPRWIRRTAVDPHA